MASIPSKNAFPSKSNGQGNQSKEPLFSLLSLPVKRECLSPHDRYFCYPHHHMDEEIKDSVPIRLQAQYAPNTRPEGA